MFCAGRPEKLLHSDCRRFIRDAIARSQMPYTANLPTKISIATFVILSATLLAQSPAPKIIGGPFVVNTGERAATVVWIVESAQVTFGAAGDKDDKPLPVLHAEKMVLNGLKPGTAYHYQAFPGDAGKGSFKTASSETTKFQFVVYGDTRTRHDVHRAVIQGVLRAANPEFVVDTGDLVENGNDTSLWPIYFDAERELLRKSPIFPVLGNHDRHSKNYFDFMDARPYYSFNWGQAHFTILDSDIGSVAGTDADKKAYWDAQVRWLEEDLAQSQKSSYRFVFAHHPPMTAVKRRQGDNPHMTALEPLFAKYHVTVAFFGHDHNYQHYLKDGIHYYVSGGGGAPLYDVDSPPPGITQKVESTENFLIVNVDPAAVQIEAKKPNGETIDTTAIQKLKVNEIGK
jgi:predicted phosphodiesterase